jgi:hypothetical protein
MPDASAVPVDPYKFKILYSFFSNSKCQHPGILAGIFNEHTSTANIVYLIAVIIASSPQQKMKIRST